MNKPLLRYQVDDYGISSCIQKALFYCIFAPLFFFSISDVKAQTLPSGFSQVLVANGISNPTVMAFAPDGRIFVAQQSGQLRIIKNGSLLSQPFLSLSVHSSGERGLLGIAFDPNFNSNHYVYLYYTLSSGANNRISRFTANGDVAVAGSEQVILNLDPLSSATNHNGGTMQFGPDGKLYVGVGENADAANAQVLSTYHGKLLRINPDGSVPPGNPYTSGSNQQLRLWAYGLRNPYTIAFQPGTGRLFVNDVGANTWEEIDDATTGGKNFGWPYAEGNNSSYSNPVYTYPHGSSVGSGCAITGGSFFNPSSTNYPSSYIGKYFFLDYCNDWIDVLTLSGTSASRANFASNIAGSPLSLVTGTDGNLYFLSRDNSAVYKITYAGSSGPVITNQPQSITVAQGNSATFNVSVTGSSPFSYQWRKNGTNISGATSSSYSISSVTSTSGGAYSVVVSNGSGSVTSNNATLTVTSANQAPTATITTPASGTTYAGGNVINFSGTATDPENGTLNTSAYNWYVIFHHGTHTHPGPTATSGVSSGSFTVPNTGETATDVFYRLYLVVTDLQGAKDTAYRDILPRTSTITLNSNPQGLNITLDGQPFTAPLTVTSVEGVLRTIGTASPQTINGSTYSFSSWSQGGSQTQTMATPVDNAVYTANFSSSGGGGSGSTTTLFQTTTIPSSSRSNDGQGIALGVKFRSTQNGFVTGVRYFKSAGTTGIHTGQLWNSTGTLLAQATFTNETASGWQQVLFSSPVAITAGVTYVASYHSPSGDYTGTSSYFTQAVVNGPLRGLANGEDGINGLYKYSATSTLPTNGYQSSNYWADVVFTGSSSDLTPPTVLSVSPVNGATGVSINTTVTANFSEAVNSSTVTGTTFQLKNGSGNVIAASVSSSSGQISLTPYSSLANSTTYTVTIKGGTSGVKDLAGNALASDYNFSFTTTSSGGSAMTIFQPTTAPSGSRSNDGQGISLGVKFRTTQNGFVTGVRYYKSAGTTGTHTGQLWSSTGTLLAQATFTNETASGWQQVLFSSPVVITAGVTYIASYHSPSGDYTGTSSYFTQAVVNGSLRALANGEDGVNGLYKYSATAVFPTNGYNASNYWSDVLFTTGSSSDMTAPTLSSVTPVNGATGVSTNTTVIANFNEAINGSTVTAATFQLKNGAGNIIPATVNTTSGQIRLTPSSSLTNSTIYTVTVTGGASGIKDLAGNAMVNNYSWSFTTASGSGSSTMTILQPTSVPAKQLNNDGLAIELGIRFRSSQNGFITGIRYYKGAGTTGTHIGSLWTNTGTKLATATFTNETASGWQQVLFTSPVAITAGVTYVASQFSPSGHYASSVNYFTQAVVNGPLRGLADGEDGINGLYKYSSSSAFPTNGHQSSNYWVDVVFTTGNETASRGIQQPTQQSGDQPSLTVTTSELNVNILPNPSNTFFNLVIKGTDRNPVTVKVFDISGQVVEKHEKIASNTTLQLGHKWIGGSYFVEVIQNNQRRFVKIIKVN